MPTTVAMSVTRTELPGSLADLVIDDHTNYEVPTFSIGSPGNVLDKIGAKWVDGEYPTSKHRGNAIANLSVDCIGSSHATAQTKLDALVDAFNQLRFNWTIVYDTTTIYRWACFAATVIEADLEARQFEHGYILPVRFTFERLPIALDGPV